MQLLTDKYGFKYYNGCPTGCVPGRIHDFIIDGEKRIGMRYLLQAKMTPRRFELYQITERTRATDLMPYIQSGQLYVFGEDVRR